MRFVINGGKKLKGEVTIAGSKNAATPIIAATLLAKTPVTLSNIPKVGDVLTMLRILESMGSRVRWLDDHALEIVNKDIDPSRLDQNLVCKIRSAILIIGPLLARFGKLVIATPGGCHIGSRPIDTHLESLKALGAIINFDRETGLYEISLENPSKNEVILREFSVTATENLLMLGGRHPLTIKLAAAEPHVVDLGNFLLKLGVEVGGLGTHTVRLRPPSSLPIKTLEHSIVSDPTEVGTFAILGAATKSEISLTPIISDHLDAVLEKLREMGVVFETHGEKLLINGPAGNLKAAKIETRPFPGLPSDLQAPFGVLATQAHGASLIFDTLYDGRLKYIDELKKMGAEATILDPHRALIKGPAVLNGTKVESLDLRAGATLVIAALIAKGESILEGAEQIDRGYERIDFRLQQLGADILRIP